MTDTDTTPKPKKERPLLGKRDGMMNAARRYELVLEALGAPITGVAADTLPKGVKVGFNAKRANLYAKNLGRPALRINRELLDHAGRVFNPLTADRDLMSQAIVAAFAGRSSYDLSRGVPDLLRGVQRAAMIDRATTTDAVGPALAAKARQQGHTVKNRSVAGLLAAAAVGLVPDPEVTAARADLKAHAEAAGKDQKAVDSLLRSFDETRRMFQSGQGNLQSAFQLMTVEQEVNPDPPGDGDGGDGEGDGDGGDGGGGGNGDNGAGPGGNGAGQGEGEQDQPNDEDYEGDDEELDNFANDLDGIRNMMEALDRQEDDVVYRRVFHGDRRKSSHHHRGWVEPDDEATQIAGRLRRTLDLARWPEPTESARPMAVPPGALRTRAAIQAEARLAAGDPSMPNDLFLRRSRRIDAPTDLSVGMAIDCSGSMDYLATACARWVYAFSQGAYRAGARFIASTWGDKAYPLADAGATMRNVPQLSCPDGTTALAESLQACIGGLDMTRPGRARILIAATDGQLYGSAYDEVAAITRRCKKYGIEMVQIFAGRQGGYEALEGWNVVAAARADVVVTKLEQLLAQRSRGVRMQ